MPLPFSIAIAQLNPTVGDIAGNSAKILDAYKQAASQGAELVICPELCLIGYPPEDLVLMPAFQKQAMQAVKDIAAKTANGPALIIGSPWEEEGKIYNAGLLLADGNVAHVSHKRLLPNYGIFDEKRIFSAGIKSQVAKWRGHAIGLMVCEDVWHTNVARELKNQGAELLIVINASPFEMGKMERRREVTSEAVQQTGLPLVYVNAVGGQDDIVFDGGSFALSADGKLIAGLPEFEEGIALLSKISSLPAPDEHWRIWSAMKLGLHDYVQKNGFGGIVLGLSGGIDSALTAACAVDALGAKRVKGVLLPSPYTSKESVEDALHSAKMLGIETMNVPITTAMEMFEEVLNPVFKNAEWMEDVSIGGNVQSRLRGMTLMAISNRFGWMLMATGNKSEVAVGYTTLYGDSCGGYNVLKDLYKTQVYALAHWRNAQGQVIPQRSITKAPSAELKPGQKDEDQLPPYEMLDKILTHHIEERLSAEEIIAKGFSREVVDKVVNMVRHSEYKRRQSCPGVKLSPMLFGKDRRYPLTNKYL